MFSVFTLHDDNCTNSAGNAEYDQNEASNEMKQGCNGALSYTRVYI
jgi:hypothetical protein